MKTKKGAYRFVIFSKNYVYKFPAFRYAWGVIKNIPRMIIHGDSRFIWKEFMWGLKNWYRGISENRSENRSWKRLQSPFLAPTSFSLWGLINIQRREDGQTPTRESLSNMLSQLPEAAQADLAQVESHCLEPGNFIETKFGLRLIDYDDGTSSSGKKLSFGTFLEKWHKELNRLMIPRIR